MVDKGMTPAQVKAPRSTLDYGPLYGADASATRSYSLTTNKFVEAVYKGLKKQDRELRLDKGFEPLPAAVVLLGISGLVWAQPGGPAPGPLPSGHASAPEVVTGYRASLVTEDWRYRMATPVKGGLDGVPLNAEGVKAAYAWDPAKDEPSGNQCKAYGAAAITRVPGRLHIAWQNDKTLKVEADAGTQTRLFQFEGNQTQTTTVRPVDSPWQGYSVAIRKRVSFVQTRRVVVSVRPRPDREGSLKVIATRMRSGYLRKNGILYSAEAVVTEYYDAIRERDGKQYLVVKIIVDDPQFLMQEFLTGTHFKQETEVQNGSRLPAPYSDKIRFRDLRESRGNEIAPRREQQFGSSQLSYKGTCSNVVLIGVLPWPINTNRNV